MRRKLGRLLPVRYRLPDVENCRSANARNYGRSTLALDCLRTAALFACEAIGGAAEKSRKTATEPSTSSFDDLGSEHAVRHRPAGSAVSLFSTNRRNAGIQVVKLCPLGSSRKFTACPDALRLAAYSSAPVLKAPS